jgi:hypothetical protein
VDKAVVGSNVHRGKDTEMSKVGKDCHWEQRSIEETTPKWPFTDKAVVGSNIQ